MLRWWRAWRSVSAWLAPAYGGGLDLRPDLDQVEGLSAEREAFSARIDKVSFLTLDEKARGRRFSLARLRHDLLRLKPSHATSASPGAF